MKEIWQAECPEIFKNSAHSIFIWQNHRNWSRSSIVFSKSRTVLHFLWKGAIALYTLSEYIGEDKLNKSLREYLDKVKFESAPYTTSIEMLQFLKNATPENLQYLITDMFETVDKEKTLMHFDKIINLNHIKY
ncbi:MAG: hypothetical protein IPO62_08825 [Saprospiraceae bacterium]|nr:hypothetical protein [Saprospiraceae bacterium]